MSRELSVTISSLFGNNSWSRAWSSHGIPHNFNIKYMEIPIDKDIFELPLFALDIFIDAIRNNVDTQVDAIAVTLNTTERIPKYKSVDRYMRDVLVESYKDHRLILLEAKQGEETVYYYGTHGAVFDKEFNPLMICSYLMERYDVNHYRYLRPILRVDPSVYVSKADPIQKFIVNKMINACLEDKVCTPIAYDCPDRFQRDTARESVKIEIDECPFMVHQADVPSVSTSNQQLLQLAINHIDELIQ